MLDLLCFVWRWMEWLQGVHQVKSLRTTDLKQTLLKDNRLVMLIKEEERKLQSYDQFSSCKKCANSIYNNWKRKSQIEEKYILFFRWSIS